MTYENLDVWKRSSRLCVKIYKAMKTTKDYGFKDQITRSALSVPSNIAEGLERRSCKEQKHFLNIARGSAAELKTQIYIGIEIDYIDRTQGKVWIKEVTDITSMIYGLLKSMN
ncbi:MAG: four helix bundle protein [Endozoicomonas sp.]